MRLSPSHTLYSLVITTEDLGLGAVVDNTGGVVDHDSDLSAGRDVDLGPGEAARGARLRCKRDERRRTNCLALDDGQVDRALGTGAGPCDGGRLALDQARWRVDGGGRMHGSQRGGKSRAQRDEGLCVKHFQGRGSERLRERNTDSSTARKKECVQSQGDNSCENRRRQDGSGSVDCPGSGRTVDILAIRNRMQGAQRDLASEGDARAWRDSLSLSLAAGINSKSQAREQTSRRHNNGSLRLDDAIEWFHQTYRTLVSPLVT